MSENSQAWQARGPGPGQRMALIQSAEQPRGGRIDGEEAAGPKGETTRPCHQATDATSETDGQSDQGSQASQASQTGYGREDFADFDPSKAPK